MVVYDEKTNRRSGMERREIPPCVQPCKPIVDDLDKRDAKLVDDLDKRDNKLQMMLKQWDEAIHRKLDKVFECLETKIPSRIFWRALGFGGFFVFVFMGGMMWSLKSTVSEIDTNVKIMNVTVNSTGINVKENIIRAEQKYNEFDRRLDKIERGDVYYKLKEKESSGIYKHKKKNYDEEEEK
jgi:hypothetical protein